MGNLRASEWYKLPMSLAELCIDTTLRCGQSFRWRKMGDEVWTCALHGRILKLRQDRTHLHYQSISPDIDTQPLDLSPYGSDPTWSTYKTEQDTESLIRHYFNLTPNLGELYDQWSLADLNFKKRAPQFTGIRILKQDAWESLVSFICSSNNNIARISQMVNNLCLHYGPFIACVDSQPFHDFPPPEALVGPHVETHLRELGFGYRAKYLAQTAMIIVKEKPNNWLESLRNTEPFSGGKFKRSQTQGRTGYKTAHDELIALRGVGPKVADCVCLMGLGWGEAVPVDTHVWQIAQRDYKFGKGKHRSLTKATYDAIGDHFRELWGKEAGWAHSVLFAADLKTFATRTVLKTEDVGDKADRTEKDDSVLHAMITTKRKLISEETVKTEVLDDRKMPMLVTASQRKKRLKVI